MAKEFWTLLNVGGTFRCHRAACNVAKNIARSKGIAIMVRHNGPRPAPNRDATRVNHYVWPNGKRDYSKSNSGEYVDVS